VIRESARRVVQVVVPIPPEDADELRRLNADKGMAFPTVVTHLDDGQPRLVFTYEARRTTRRTTR
jgi:hypothetical protein